MSVCQTRKILLFRMHMIRIPGNYKQLGITTCPLCNSNEINTEHYFNCYRCKRLTEVWNVREDDMHTQDVNRLKDLANFFEKVEQLLEPMMEIKKKEKKLTTEKEKERTDT